MREPWYQRGLFSLHAIPWNMQKSLFEGFNDYPHFPYIRFFPFGCSIFLSSPFLFLLFREGGKFKTAAWLVIGGGNLRALVTRKSQRVAILLPLRDGFDSLDVFASR
jgi:hypothetical protein